MTTNRTTDYTPPRDAPAWGVFLQMTSPSSAYQPVRVGGFHLEAPGAAATVSAEISPEMANMQDAADTRRLTLNGKYIINPSWNLVRNKEEKKKGV